MCYQRVYDKKDCKDSRYIREDILERMFIEIYNNIVKNKHPKGLKENIRVAKSGGKAALIAKNYYEEVTGNKAVSNMNMLNYEYIDNEVKNEVGSDKGARITRSRNSKRNIKKESIK